MQATIEIKIQRNQATGKLTFDPNRVLDTPEHALIKKGFDRLVEDLNEIVNSGVASNSSNTVEQPAVVIEAALAPLSETGAPSIKDPLAQGVNLIPSTAPKTPEPSVPTAQSRLDEAKTRGNELVKSPAPAVGVIGEPPQSTTKDTLAQGVTLTPNVQTKAEAKAEAAAKKNE